MGISITDAHMKSNYRLIINCKQLRSADIKICSHIDAIVPCEPVFGGELIGWIAHHLVETGGINRTLAGENWNGRRSACPRDTYHPHGTIIQVELRSDVAIGSDAARGSLLDASDVDVHIGNLRAT